MAISLAEAAISGHRLSPTPRSAAMVGARSAGAGRRSAQMLSLIKNIGRRFLGQIRGAEAVRH